MLWKLIVRVLKRSLPWGDELFEGEDEVCGGPGEAELEVE